jgi:murein DD-endopeptidase MepM/ murein hydrolase activator NlpD
MSHHISQPGFQMPRRRFLAGLAGGALTVVLLADRAEAYDVAITPTNPQLGDTISVVAVPRNSAAATSPVVTVNGSTQYPAFPISGNRFRALIPTSPLDPPGRLVIQISGSGEETRNLAVGLQNRSFPTQRITLSSSQSDLGTQYEFDRVAQFKSIVTPEKFWNGTLLRPSQGRVSTEYGVRRYYNGVFAQDYYHRGVDYAAGAGSPVVAPAAGHIALVGQVSEGFELHGNTIGIDHGQGLLSIMIHLSRIDVNEGAFVQAGQTIGAVGSTGASTGPHLHWGLYVHGVAVDPVPWRYTGME